jgi:hypothetical protein
MQFRVTVEGVDSITKLAEQFGRQGKFAMAKALTQTAVAVRDEIKREMPRALDRPTPYTLNSLKLNPARPGQLSASVWVKDEVAGGGTPATRYLLPQVEGGGRSIKRFEQALQISGHMPKGWYVVPGAGANLDRYGNISRGQVVQILSQLRVQLVAGSERRMGYGAKSIAAQRKAGGRFFVVPSGQRLAPGIYQREFMGRTVTPVVIYVRRVNYQRRFDFYGTAERVAAAQLRPRFAAALNEALRTAFPRQQTSLF